MEDGDIDLRWQCRPEAGKTHRQTIDDARRGDHVDGRHHGLRHGSPLHRITISYLGSPQTNEQSDEFPVPMI